MSASAGRRVGAVLVGLAFLLLGLAGMSAWQGAARLRGRDTERARAVATARGFVEAAGTFDYRAPNAQHTRLAALTAGVLHETFAAAQPDPSAVAQQRVATVRILTISVLSLARDEAHIDVTSQQWQRGLDPATSQPVEATVQQRLTLRLVRVPDTDAWRVSAMRVVTEEPTAATVR
jgi:hypothetical protein